MKSRITYVDGVKGTIQYRMYTIEDLFKHHDFEEVAHLLIWGALPSLERKLALRTELNEGLKAPTLVTEAIGKFPSDAPPYSMVLAGLAAYAASDPSSNPTAANRPGMYQGDDVGVIDKSLVRTISSMAVIVALTYCRQRNRVITAPDPQASFVCNVLLMMGFVDEETKKPKPTVVESLERLWILYCDHEMTNSTAAFLHVASTLADPISCCSAYVVSGNGPLHAGAVDLAYKALVQLGTPDKVPEMIADVKAKKYRLFGYGHRIYRTVDPRTKFIKAMLKESKDHGRQNPLLAVALEIDRIASTDPYFTLRNLQANADLYGSFVYMALGFESDIIAAMMMLSRMPGVMAHWRETRVEQQCRLWRPQQVYIGCDAQDISPCKGY
ncbi:MAG: hypothetical protein L6R42_003918 [Xanthoria sp. 1 TBL-2021]|nr:MAG: hypothetical protein L6R42_003918 [Xanthoria sp. 1 TBL-2021]